MTYEVRGKEDLNVAGCEFVARGETPADVVEQVVEHLRQEHGIDMPDAGAIVEDQVDRTTLQEGVRLVVDRLQEALNISGVGTAGTETQPAMPPPKGPSLSRH